MSDKFYMAHAERMASESKDRSTKTGCVLVGEGGYIIARGRNELPHGVSDTADRRERPEKYFWTEHAERNAIYQAAAAGSSLEGSTAYVTWYPCIDCARGLVQVGVKRIVCKPVNLDHEKYAEDFKRVAILFNEAGVEVSFIEEAA